MVSPPPYAGILPPPPTYASLVDDLSLRPWEDGAKDILGVDDLQAIQLVRRFHTDESLPR